MLFFETAGNYNCLFTKKDGYWACHSKNGFNAARTRIWSADRRNQRYFVQLLCRSAFYIYGILSDYAGDLRFSWHNRSIGSIIGAMTSKRLLTVYAPEKIIHTGCLVMTSGAVLLAAASSMVTGADLIRILTILASVFIMLMGAGMALPNCLSLALAGFQDVIGTAGAIFSLGYYILVSLATWGMSVLHNGSLLTMPIYFLVISGGMWLLSIRFIRAS